MKIYDISQEIFNCDIFPGDDRPVKIVAGSIKNGDPYNLTSFSMCAHNGTHIDAPFHFLDNGKTIDKLELVKMIGYCYVAEIDGEVNAESVKNLIQKAELAFEGSSRRLLLKGEAIITVDAAKSFADAEIFLIGVESQTVGALDEIMNVHKILLEKNIVLLEGIRLGEVDEGVYFLSAPPLDLGGADGAPCRAVLISF